MSGNEEPLVKSTLASSAAPSGQPEPEASGMLFFSHERNSSTSQRLTYGIRYSTLWQWPSNFESGTPTTRSGFKEQTTQESTLLLCRFEFIVQRKARSCYAPSCTREKKAAQDVTWLRGASFRWYRMAGEGRCRTHRRH